MNQSKEENPIRTKGEILEKHCPSMSDIFLDYSGRAFRDRILKAMEEYHSQFSSSYRSGEESKWISVSESQPENGFYNVLCNTDDGEIQFSLWFWEGRWCFDNMVYSGEPIFIGPTYIEVTHWQPLPEAPKNP